MGWRSFLTTQLSPNGTVFHQAPNLGRAQGPALRYDKVRRAEPSFGGYSTKMQAHGGWAGGPLVTCQNGMGRNPRPPCQPVRRMLVG